MSCEVFGIHSLARFDVARFGFHRANGPAIYLAQPERLGFSDDVDVGLKARPLTSAMLTA
jgi:hypothetical protein